MDDRVNNTSGGVSKFGVLERERQARFREGLSTPSDAVERRHDYLLALGCEEENLFPTLRGDNGACRYFAERNIKWWQAGVSGDASDGKRPTRNMASSQIACVNFLLPLVDIPGALTAVLQAIDEDVTGVVEIVHEGTSSPVELEWIGLDHALEGPSVKTRGANSTSVDAFMVAETPTGRRAYLMEWKYVEEYRTEDKGIGSLGRDTAVQVRPPVRRFAVVQRQSSVRCVALRTLLPDPPAAAARGPDGPQRRARGFGGEGRCRRSRGKPSLSGARDVAMASRGSSRTRTVSDHPPRRPLSIRQVRMYPFRSQSLQMR